jgi:hypothetical protein
MALKKRQELPHTPKNRQGGSVTVLGERRSKARKMG